MNAKAKILTLTSSFPKSPDDISGRFVKDLADELVKKGRDIVVLAPHSPGLAPVETSGDFKIYRFKYWYPARYQILTNGAILPKLSGNVLAALQIPFFVSASFLSCVRLARKQKPDAIHTHWLLPQGLVGAMVSKISGKPHLATIHAGGLVALGRMPFKRLIAKFIVKNSSAISAVSGFIKRKFLNLLDDKTRSEADSKISTIPMGVHPERFEGKNTSESRTLLGLKRSDFVVLFVGRLSEKKGVEDLLVAFQSLSQEGARLWIVGSGPLHQNLKDRASGQGSGEVQFFGRVSDDKLDELYLAADVVAVPSVTTSYGDVEGLPVVVMEAMAAGKPVIGTDVGGISDAIENEKTGLLIPERSPEIIASALRRLYGDEEFRETLAKNAAEKAKALYSWSTISEKFDSILEDMIHGRKT